MYLQINDKFFETAMVFCRGSAREEVQAFSHLKYLRGQHNVVLRAKGCFRSALEKILLPHGESKYYSWIVQPVAESLLTTLSRSLILYRLAH